MTTSNIIAAAILLVIVYGSNVWLNAQMAREYNRETKKRSGECHPCVVFFGPLGTVALLMALVWEAVVEYIDPDNKPISR